jgi:hypothetical protein
MRDQSVTQNLTKWPDRRWREIRLPENRFAVFLVVAGGEDSGDLPSGSSHRILPAHSRYLDDQLDCPGVTAETHQPVRGTVDSIQKPQGLVIEGLRDGHGYFVVHEGHRIEQVFVVQGVIG